MALLTWLYDLLLRLYPVGFRAEFGDEMRRVFTDALIEAAGQERPTRWAVLLRELRDLPAASLREHWLSLRGEQEVSMNDMTVDSHADQGATTARERPASWEQTVAGMAPLLFGLVVIMLGALTRAVFRLFNLPDSTYYETTFLVITSDITLALAAAFMAALIVGWVKGFPRWCFPYWGLAFVISLMMTGAATPGLIILGHQFGRRELWSWHAWIPLLVVAAVSLLITRSLRPLRGLILGVWHDWTRVSFAFYGLLPIAWFITFDEVRGDEPFVAFLGVILALGAGAYLRSTATWQRVASLVAAFAVGWVAATVYLALYWHGRKEFWMMRPGEWMQTARSMGIMGAMLLTLLVMPVVIEALRRTVNIARGQPAAG